MTKINQGFIPDGMKGFPNNFVDWAGKSVSNGKVAIMVNDKIGPYFPTKEGLRQGDPFSPILFNITLNVLAVQWYNKGSRFN